MTIAYFALAASLFGLWRRWLGCGLFEVHRYVKLSVFFGLSALTLWLPHHTGHLGALGAILWLSSAFVVYWVVGQDVTSWRANVGRYGLPAFFIFAPCGALHPGLGFLGAGIGALVCLSWWYEMRTTVRNPEPQYLGGWIDGPHSIAEHLAGASVGLGFAAAGMLL